MCILNINSIVYVDAVRANPPTRDASQKEVDTVTKTFLRYAYQRVHKENEVVAPEAPAAAPVDAADDDRGMDLLWDI